MMRALPFALFVVACGSATPAVAPPSATAPPDAAPSAAIDAPPVDAPPVDAPPPPPPPVAIVEGVITAGPHSPETITTLLSPRLPALAQCLSADGLARATEVSFTVVGDDTEMRVAWQSGELVALPCLNDVLGAPGTVAIEWDTKFSTVYAVIRSAPPGVEPPPAPPPPVARADTQLLFCDLPKASGADDLPREARYEVLTSYARAHVRHPAALHIAAEVAQWNVAERIGRLKRTVRAAGIKRCAMQGF